MTIHVIGDSHATHTFGGLTCVHSHCLGPITMHRVGRDGYTWPHAWLAAGDHAIFSFGEIDVRSHIHSQRMRPGRSLEEIITTLVEKYIVALSRFNPLRVHVSAMSVVPPAYVAAAGTDLEYPFVGTDQERSLYAKSLNRALSERCRRAGLGFIDVYSAYVDEQGMLPPKYSDGHVHIANSVYAAGVLRDAGLL